MATIKSDNDYVQQIISNLVPSLTKEDFTRSQSKVLKKNGVNSLENVSETDTFLFSDIDQAVEAAAKAHKKILQYTLANRGKMLDAIREKIRKNLSLLAQTELNETGYGRYEDKCAKILLVADKTPGIEDIQPEVYTGDGGLTLIEKRAYGVGCCILPSTGPTSTAVHNGLCMLAAGNGVVFSPHPSALRSTFKAIELMNDAVREVGGPENMFFSIKNVTLENTHALMQHPKVDLIVATGGPGVVRAALSSGTKTIGAGPGNPPVLVDETADIPKAARDIIAGNSFENGIQCNGEKECFVIDGIADLLIAEMQRNGAYLIKNADTVDQLTNLVTGSDGRINRKYIGKDAQIILGDLGIQADSRVRTIIYEVPFDHITVTEEYLMPILPIVRVKNVDEGIKRAVEAEGKNRHSAVLHSRDVHTITEYAKAIATTILVKNGPSYSGVGYGGEGYTTMTIAGPTGEGLTRPKSFTRETRCALVGEFNVRSGKL